MLGFSPSTQSLRPLVIGFWRSRAGSWKLLESLQPVVEMKIHEGYYFSVRKNVDGNSGNGKTQSKELFLLHGCSNWANVYDMFGLTIKQSFSQLENYTAHPTTLVLKLSTKEYSITAAFKCVNKSYCVHLHMLQLIFHTGIWYSLTSPSICL